MRRITADYAFEPSLRLGWLDPYKAAWDLLRTTV